MALQACQIFEEESGLSVSCYDLRFLKPLDERMLHEVFSTHEAVITVEDNVLSGGMGSTLLEFMGDHDYQVFLKRLGIPDYFPGQGTIPELQRECGIDRGAVLNALKNAADRLKLNTTDHRKRKTGMYVGNHRQ